MSSEKYRTIRIAPETRSAIVAVGNQDLKTVSYLSLVVDGPFTKSGLGRHAEEHTGVDGIRFTSAGHAEPFVKKGFAATSEGHMHRGRPSTMYHAGNERLALPIIGEMIDWSDQHELSIVTTLAPATSRGSEGAINAIQLFDGLSAGHQVHEIDLLGYAKTKQGWDTSHNRLLHSLVEKGLVISDDEPEEFTILDPAYNGPVPYSDLSAKHQLTYQALQAAKILEGDNPQTIPSIEQMAFDLGIIDEESLPDLHAGLVRAVSIASPAYFPGAVEKIELSRRGNKYRLSDAFAGPAADLVRRVALLDTSETYRKTAADVAHDFYRDQPTMARVATRGLQSPFIGRKAGVIKAKK